MPYTGLTHTLAIYIAVGVHVHVCNIFNSHLYTQDRIRNLEFTVVGTLEHASQVCWILGSCVFSGLWVSPSHTLSLPLPLTLPLSLPSSHPHTEYGQVQTRSNSRAAWSNAGTYTYSISYLRWNAGIHDYGKVRMTVLRLSRAPTNCLDLVRAIVWVRQPPLKVYKHSSCSLIRFPQADLDELDKQDGAARSLDVGVLRNSLRTK